LGLQKSEIESEKYPEVVQNIKIFIFSLQKSLFLLMKRLLKKKVKILQKEKIKKIK
jgi:hypothetical protein